MLLRPPRSTRSDPRLPYPSRFRARPVGAVLLEIGAGGGDVVFGQNALDPLQHAIVDFYRGLVRGDLHGGRLAEEIRQRIKYADQQRGEYGQVFRSEEHTSELQSLMRISYAVFCLKKQTKNNY